MSYIQQAPQQFYVQPLVQPVQYQPVQLQVPPMMTAQQVPQQAPVKTESHVSTALLYAFGYIFPVVWIFQLFLIFNPAPQTKLWGYRALSALLMYLVIIFVVLFSIALSEDIYCWNTRTRETQTKQFYCEICDYATDSIDDMENHVMAYHANVCSLCGKTLKTDKLLDIHISEKHDNYFAVKATQIPSYQCFDNSCDKVFLTPSDRFSHMERYHHWAPMAITALQNAL
ncbi:hypothetical protein EIN_428030 [Entamoeba invadens IP1]|uniref:C2H2-type domain-containing protein n=1 Tax=Entamoeba invadens IP1 TaxID=370355 RepID=A0A0A1UHD4_ENTIV|nr:hypothetical protein EIN_428030 [Entamoeba invadens IP1]ELP95127.1 hypothetical protein EIN_428030 [Entamoeba invadens IP1]|eukprot:XP_004261898.1 hypothetical protein EIN_428030 [Entamoeba invadens IP1]